MPQPNDSAPTNRLLIPLALVSILCIVEAVVIAFLLGRGHSPPPVTAELSTPAGAQHDTPAPAPEAPTPSKPTTPSIARGKVGQPVDSGGVIMTVVTVSNEPRFKELFTPGPTEKFVDVEVLIENRTQKGFGYYSNQFTLKDGRDRLFSSTALGAGEPALGWGTIVQGDKVRGHLAFVLPRDATGLTLTCPIDDTPGGAHAIHIDLGQ